MKAKVRFVHEGRSYEVGDNVPAKVAKVLPKGYVSKARKVADKMQKKIKNK